LVGKLIDLKICGDDRGSLIALENNTNVPFDIKRVFYIYGTQQGISRGNHSHYKTKQFLISINGSCKVTLDNGKEKQTFNLDKPNIGLLQDAFIWGTMHDFSDDCVLMVLADDIYKESDYIKEYDEFLKVLKND